MESLKLTVLLLVFVLSSCTEPGVPEATNRESETLLDPPLAGERSDTAQLRGSTPAALRERIIYSSLRPGNWDIFLFSSPGESPTQLTKHLGLDYDAIFTPDGRWVVFTSERRGNPDLYAIDLEQGGEPRLLIDSETMEDQAAISPDGQTLLFAGTRDGGTDIYSIVFDPLNTQLSADAVNLTNSLGGDFRPAFSPNGSLIAFSSDRDTPAYGHPFFPFTRQREGEIYLMNADGSAQRRLTDSRSWDGSPEWSRDGATLYFYSARPRELPGPPTSSILGQEGGFRIWAMNADGSDVRAITPEGLEALAPALALDGRIAFQTRTGPSDWRIESVAPDGTDQRLESDAARAYWVPDYDDASGAMVAHGIGPVAETSQAVDGVLGAGALLASDYPVDIDRQGLALTLYPMRHTTGIAPHPFSNENMVTIESPGGTQVVRARFDGGGEREMFRVDGIGILSGSRDRLFDMKWSSDGQWFLYSQGTFAGDESTKADIWLMSADGSSRRNLTEAVDANDGVAAFSPDGQRIVFRSARDGNFDLYLMDRDGGNVVRLTNTEARENFPVFSPSGDEIVFSSDRDSALDALGYKTFDNYILELNSDGTPGATRRLTEHPGQDGHPWYSPDGEWVVFTSERDGITDEEPMVQEVVFGPQMYGEIYAQRLSDGVTIRLTHNKWEEGNPFWFEAVRDGLLP
jgi:Tol biopolymer transport system component